ncbi:branched-chain amino acid ABC transporter substrate-binding protein [Saccharothrix sp. ALI-22-I]|uniref:ABC transporter substrate-binding protein n=1 Tax=Saccharothrix sp. ALI-22-I TaxID=1933778 RepID=UPI00097BFC5E|nr:ABC transporter substrate-binding protein [Saccharothrix sp. ALI-22-I]ONI89104.1 branched-chain amino acid ABC transporter substrate-binding protein [Saccharothrix sp. ALI-22-I]
MARHRAVLALFSVVALAAVACRGGDGAAPQEGKGGIKVDFGVTSEPCPGTGHSDRGCIYLGSISDLTEGPFKTLAVPITEAQKAYWKRVNDQGGIGGYDVDVTSYVKDNKYNPQIHNQVYQEIKGKVLALAQTLGSPTTAAILPDLESTQMVSVPASWTSLWGVEEVILESGANYCIESMNSVDYAADELGAKSVMAVHLPGDYGDDAAAGAKLAAEKRGLTFTNAVTQTGQDNQGGAIDAVLANKPDVVILTTGPTDAAVIIGQTAARGFTGKFIGTSPTWNPGLMASPAAPAIKALYMQSAPWKAWETDTPGHNAMRAALPDVTPNDGYTAGWVWSYPLKAALMKAAENKDLTRAGLLGAVRELDSVDYEGMLPSGAGNFSGNSNDATFRQTLIYKPDDAAATKVTLVEDFFTGPTATDFKFEKPCYT